VAAREEPGRKGWRSERVLRRELESRHIPDGLVTLPGRGIEAVELELTRKSLPRYLDMFSRYVRWEAPSLNSGLYVAPEKTDLAHLFGTVLPAVVAMNEPWGPAGPGPEPLLAHDDRRAGRAAGLVDRLDPGEPNGRLPVIGAKGLADAGRGDARPARGLGGGGVGAALRRGADTTASPAWSRTADALHGHEQTWLGSAREVDEYHVSPDLIRQLAQRSSTLPGSTTSSLLRARTLTWLRGR